MSSAKGILVGRLGKDPEVRDTKAGRVVEMSVATDQRGDRPTIWWRVSCWGKLGEVVLAHLQKGREVVCMGAIGLDEWAGQDGKRRPTLTLEASSVDFVGGKGEQAQGQQPTQPQRPAQGGGWGSRPPMPGDGSGWAASGEARDRGQGQAMAGPPPNDAPPFSDDDIPF